MALQMYRRHRRECEGKHPEEMRSGELEEGRRGWKRCLCPIHISGTLSGKFKRRSTERTNWDEAREIEAALRSSGSWDGNVPEAPIPIKAVSRVTIERAIAAFLADHGLSLASNTLRKYRTILNKLRAFSSLKGYVLLEQLAPIDVREFRASWQVSAFTASKNMTVVRSFFEFAVSNEWLPRNPSRLVKDPRGQSSQTERVPFSDAELSRMFQACDEQYGQKAVGGYHRIQNEPGSEGVKPDARFKWSGQDVADFISVSVYTGLRISDVTTFHSDRLLSTGECHIRTTKNGRKVYTWIPDWLQERIRIRALERGRLIFGDHKTTDINVITDVWRRRLKRLWAICGPWPEAPTPHRFRHTFARILLEKAGVGVRDVAELLGDTEEIVRKHYAAWVPERQARLTKILQDAFDQKPKPKLVALPGGRL